MTLTRKPSLRAGVRLFVLVAVALLLAACEAEQTAPAEQRQTPTPASVPQATPNQLVIHTCPPGTSLHQDWRGFYCI